MTQPIPPDDEAPLSDDDAPDAPPPGAPLRVVTDDEAPDPDWSRALARTDKGITKDPGNAALILSHSSAWDGVLEHDVFADRITVGTCPPLPKLPAGWASLAPPRPGEITAEHVTFAGLWIRRQWSQSFGPEAIHAGLVYAAKLRPVHPLRDYLDRCAVGWDGTARVEAWLSTYLGGASTDAAGAVYLANVGRWWMVSAIARAFDPGCKVDHVLVLEGDQGARKNQALEVLFSPWYLPELPDLRDKDSMHCLSGVWCALNDELGATRRGDVERAKSFFSRREDVYRPPYERHTVRRPRSCIFAATTNEAEYLLDVTGNRRWWPVRVRSVAVDDLRRDRDQLWGEAVHLYRDGAQWWPDASLTSAVSAEQDRRVQTDEWEARIARLVHGLERVTVGECLTDLGIEPGKWTQGDQMRVGRCLRRLEWRVTWEGARADRRRVWLPPG